MNYCHVNVSGKPDGHGSYMRTSIGTDPYTESDVQPGNDQAVPNIDGGSYRESLVQMVVSTN